MQIIPKNISELKATEDNPRLHNLDQIEQIAKSISQFGFNNPILIDKDNNVIAGHGRLLAATKLNLEIVPTIELSHLTEGQKKAYIIADNKLSLNSYWDYNLLTEDLKEIQDLDIDMDSLGFTPKEIDNFLNYGYDNDKNTDTESEWKDMPQFNQDEKGSFRTVIVHFHDQSGVEDFFNLVKQPYTEKTKTVWFPEWIKESANDKAYGEI